MRQEDSEPWYNLAELRMQGVLIDEERQRPADPLWVQHPSEMRWKYRRITPPKPRSMA